MVDEEPVPDDEIRDELPEDLDASGLVGPYMFPNNNRRRIPGLIYLIVGAGCIALWAGYHDGGVFVNFSQPAAPAPERGIRVELTHVIPDPVGLRRVVDDVATNGLKTRVADVRPLSEAARAHQRLHAGGFHGKIVLEV